jgi:hypothetical protein
MTAISAAVVELKAHCAHTWELIRTLERFEQVVEGAHPPSAVATPGVEYLAPAVAPDPTDVSKTAILQALRKAGEPVSQTELGKALKRSAYQLKPHLDALVRIGGVVKTGATSSTRYAIAARLRSDPAAGTPRGPAGGSGSDHRPGTGPSAAREDVRVAWNGTKERSGDVPSLLPPRERKA